MPLGSRLIEPRKGNPGAAGGAKPRVLVDHGHEDRRAAEGSVEGGVLVYRSKSWFSLSGGSFEAIERGVQTENTGYPIYPYPDPRQYWTGIMQILPDSGTGDYADFVYGTIVIHNTWNNPDKADLVGEVCSP